MARIKYQICNIPYFYKKNEKEFLVVAEYIKYFDIKNRGYIFSGIKSVNEVDKEGNLTKLKKYTNFIWSSKITFFTSVGLTMVDFFALIFGVYGIFNGNIVGGIFLLILTAVIGLINSELGMVISKYFLVKKPKSFGWTFQKGKTFLLNDLSVLTDKNKLFEPFKIF